MLRRTAFALLSALSLLAGAAQAAEPRLEVTPFLGSVACSAWQPFTVTVTNPANARAFSGEVRLQLTDMRRGYGTLGSWTRPIQLAPGDSKQVTITAGIPYGVLPTAQANLVQGSGQSSQIVASEKFEGLRVRPYNAIVVLNLSSDINALNQIDNLGTDFRVDGADLSYASYGGSMMASPPPAYEDSSVENAPRAAGKAAGPHSRLQAISLTPAELPADALGLNSITAIYIDKTTVLTPQQKLILDNYVSSGGLLITGTAGQESITSQGIGTRASLNPGSPAGWRSALHKRANPSGFLSTLSKSSFNSSYSDLSNTVEIGDGTAPLSIGGLLLFLGIYIIVLVPAQYVILKRLDKREWAWGVTPALAVLFALAAYGFGQRGRSRETFFNVASVVEMEAGRSTGQAITGVGLFSPTYSTYDLGIKSTGPTRLHNSGKNAESLVSGVPTLRNLSVPMWSIESTEAVSEVTLGQGLEVKRHGNDVTLINNTGQVLHSIRVGNAINIDRLNPGQSRTVPVPLWKDNSYPTFTGSDDASNRMSQRLWNLMISHTHQQKSLIVTAWLDTPPVEIELNGKPTTPKHQANLLVVYAPQK